MSSPKSHTARSKSKGLPSFGGEPISCQFCSGQQFRRSRLRNDDIGHLLLLSYPVRCLRCGERQYVSFFVAALSMSSSKRQPRPAMHRPLPDTNWTEPAERMVLRRRDDEPSS